VIAVAANISHSLALKGDGTLQAWGSNIFQQSTVPANMTGVIAMDAWSNHNLALVAG
jgi:alpha-tubulin suppressor-like RCC1 family protein